MKKIFLLLILASSISACGVKGDPLPPEKRPEKSSTQEIIKKDVTPISEALDADGDEEEIKKVQ